MKIIKIIMQITVLYIFSAFGDWLHNFLNFPIPGSIIGMFLLLLALILKVFPLNWIETGANFLLVYLPLVFIPTIVGIMNYSYLFAGTGMILLFVIMVSTLFVMISAGLTSQLLANKTKKRKEKKLCQDYLSQ
jgi:holin-like protein